MNIHQEMLEALMKDRSLDYLDNYIAELEGRIAGLTGWLKHVKEIRKRKARQSSPESGVRGGH